MTTNREWLSAINERCVKSTATVGTFTSDGMDSERLTIEAILEVLRSLGYVPRIIKVWKARGFGLLPIPDTPHFIESLYVATDKVFIMAGFGVVCGKDAYKFLREQGFTVEWTEKKPE